MTVSAPATHNASETRFVEAAEIAFAYRRFGRPAGLPIRSYHNAAHGFLSQYPAEVAADVSAFLAREEGRAGS
jgi:hypothetical protein